jgi:hypothetical protein
LPLLTAQATRLGESGYDRAACTEFPEGTLSARKRVQQKHIKWPSAMLRAIVRSEAVNLFVVGCDKRAEQSSRCAGAEI